MVPLTPNSHSEPLNQVLVCELTATGSASVIQCGHCFIEVFDVETGIPESDDLSTWTQSLPLSRSRFGEAQAE
jgi:hypothetical protein